MSSCIRDRNRQDENEGCVVGAREIVADESARLVVLREEAKTEGAGDVRAEIE